MFIINQPVRNVIRAGNNLIVETEPSGKSSLHSPQLQQMSNMGELDPVPLSPKHESQEAAIENISNILKNDPMNSSLVPLSNHEQPIAYAGVQLIKPKLDESRKEFEVDHQNNEKPKITEKTKKKPVPQSEKDAVYWERVIIIILQGAPLRTCTWTSNRTCKTPIRTCTQKCAGSSRQSPINYRL